MLVVDDEEMIRKTTTAMLTRLGFTVIAACDGAEALERFREQAQEIRCVLCDLTMPRMDGWETLAALRRIVPDVPAILASGYDEAYVTKDHHTEVPQAFLGKPYSLQQLKDTVHRVLADKEIPHRRSNTEHEESHHDQ